MALILPGVHQIPVDYHGRPLNLYLLIGESASVLMDAGNAPVPEHDILPYFSSIGFDPAKLTYIMVTHPDVDHTGGLSRMVQACPQARLLCGTADRQQIEDPEALIELRYRAYYKDYGVGPDDAAKAKLRPRCGGPVHVDLTFDTAGELRLGPNQVARVMHLPGHSHGLLGLHLPWHNTALVDDAIQGIANNYLDGRQAFAPTYMYVDPYLSTIGHLESMNLARMYSCHWDNKETPEAVRAFLKESRDYAIHAERVISDTVKNAGNDGITLADICVAAKPQLGTWPAERDMDTRSLAMGHLERLLVRGTIRARKDRPIRFRFENL